MLSNDISRRIYAWLVWFPMHPVYTSMNTIHCVTFHYATLHRTTLQYTALHYMTLQCIILHHSALHYIACIHDIHIIHYLHALQYSTKQYDTKQRNAIHHNTTQFNTMQIIHPFMCTEIKLHCITVITLALSALALFPQRLTWKLENISPSSVFVNWGHHAGQKGNHNVSKQASVADDLLLFATIRDPYQSWLQPHRTGKPHIYVLTMVLIYLCRYYLCFQRSMCMIHNTNVEHTMLESCRSPTEWLRFQTEPFRWWSHT